VVLDTVFSLNDDAFDEVEVEAVPALDLAWNKRLLKPPPPPLRVFGFSRVLALVLALRLLVLKEVSHKAVAVKAAGNTLVVEDMDSLVDLAGSFFLVYRHDWSEDAASFFLVYLLYESEDGYVLAMTWAWKEATVERVTIRDRRIAVTDIRRVCSSLCLRWLWVPFLLVEAAPEVSVFVPESVSVSVIVRRVRVSIAVGVFAFADISIVFYFANDEYRIRIVFLWREYRSDRYDWIELNASHFRTSDASDLVMTASLLILIV
jgi:hypothetical protein